MELENDSRMHKHFLQFQFCCSHCITCHLEGFPLICGVSFLASTLTRCQHNEILHVI